MSMRSWTYSYKTRDGLRHEAEMSAPTKDDVYAALRERGIRAIRVDERIAPIVRRGFSGLRKRDWLILVLIGLVVLLVVVVGLVSQKQKTANRIQQTAKLNAQTSASARDLTQCSAPDYLRLSAEVDVLLDHHRRELETVDVELLANYALLENSTDVTRFRAEISKGRRVVAASRKAAKELFSRYYTKIAATGAAAQTAVQHLYGLLMNEIDATEEQFGCDECAIELLDANRGKWCVVRGAVKWNDPAAESQFAFFRRNSMGEKK